MEAGGTADTCIHIYVSPAVASGGNVNPGPFRMHFIPRARSVVVRMSQDSPL